GRSEPHRVAAGEMAGEAAHDNGHEGEQEYLPGRGGTASQASRHHHYEGDTHGGEGAVEPCPDRSTATGQPAGEQKSTDGAERGGDSGGVLHAGGGEDEPDQNGEEGNAQDTESEPDQDRSPSDRREHPLLLCRPGARPRL